MAFARTPTLLSLDRYAKIMGINPAHFNQAVDGGGTYIPLDNKCSDLWFQEAFIHSDSVGREDLARAINQAESDIARELGWWPGPKWFEQEIRQFPRPYRPDVWRYGGCDVRGTRVGIKSKWAKIIQAGQREVTLVASPTTAAGTITYTDADGDGFVETATVTASTTLTDEREVKVYFPSESGAREWEIRPARTKAISGGTFTATFWVWQFILPSALEAIPTVEGPQGIDVTDTSMLLTSCDVYREFTDFTDTSATFFWEPTPRRVLTSNSSCCDCGGSGCIACEFTTQNGCLHVRDAERGIFVPQPATYDSDNAQWNQGAYSCARDPDFVRVYYYAGALSDRWLSGETDDPLSEEWARTIAWMATARLERPFCHCGVLTALATRLQRDMSFSSGEGSFNIAFEELANPFGTRFGEMYAWRKVRGDRRRIVNVSLA